MIRKSLSFFILEPVIHIDKIDGYQIFAHNPKAEDISDAIKEIYPTEGNKIKIKLNPIKQDTVEEVSFEERCTEYFQKNFEVLAKETPIILPCKEPEKFKEIVKTMENWCRKTNNSPNSKGLVLHSSSYFISSSSSVVRHLEHFGFTREALKKSFRSTCHRRLQPTRKRVFID